MTERALEKITFDEETNLYKKASDSTVVLIRPIGGMAAIGEVPKGDESQRYALARREARKRGLWRREDVGYSESVVSGSELDIVAIYFWQI